MACIRAELGADALILGTRRVSDGVEITAAVNREPTPPHDPEREQLLAWHGVPASLAASLQGGALESALARALRFAATPLAENAPPLLLVGPPGAGKTLTVARLATAWS